MFKLNEFLGDDRTAATIKYILPLLSSLASDPESIIRQHLASQLLPLSLTCMFGDDANFDPNSKTKTRNYDSLGYNIVITIILNHANALIIDADMDVRKAASDAIATLALHIKRDDVTKLILQIPLMLAYDDDTEIDTAKGTEKNDCLREDIRITATNLLGDMASLDSMQIPCAMVSQYITPTILALCKDKSFRVRRAAVQALPRLVNGSAADDVHINLLPCFVELSKDSVYRVRKAVGECLVDMSRSLMLLVDAESTMSTLSKNNLSQVKTSDLCQPSDEKEKGRESNPYFNQTKDELKEAIILLRRQILIPICSNLLQDKNKIVRYGMMQFLGPFIASFFPLDDGKTDDQKSNGIIKKLCRDDNESSVGGMGAQFFPHANGMVSRLDPHNDQSATNSSTSPTSSHPPLDSIEYLESRLPKFLRKSYKDAKSLIQILHHRDKNPPSPGDLSIVRDTLLKSYVELSTIRTGDDNVDAEMRVYCAYSFPAVVLLMGKEGWDTSLKVCFLNLITGLNTVNDSNGETDLVFPVPLPVKRCLASSFHTLCYTLGKQFINSNSDEKEESVILSTFESHFLRDSDDTVRLNVIRNLPPFLTILNQSRRSMYLPVLNEIITGDAMLGATKRRSSSNPTLLNWRQRNMVAQILPSLIILFDPSMVRKYLWPIVQILMTDSVSVVRENVEWSIPILFRRYEAKVCSKASPQNMLLDASKFNAEACGEVLTHLKITLLERKRERKSSKRHKKKNSSAFSNRQSYCRILSATALLLRMGGGDRRKKSVRQTEETDDRQVPCPYSNVTSDEYRHIHHILQNYLLPPAMGMKDDKVTNVRLVFVKSLRVMPLDIRNHDEVKDVLQTLEDEMLTWEGGGGMHLDNSKTIDTRQQPSKKIATIQDPSITSSTEEICKHSSETLSFSKSDGPQSRLSNINSVEEYSQEGK